MNKVEITICVGSSCHLKGSRDVVKIFERLVAKNSLEGQVEMKGSFCMGECSVSGVCVSVDGQRFHVVPYEAESFFQNEILGKLPHSGTAGE